MSALSIFPPLADRDAPVDVQVLSHSRRHVLRPRVGHRRPYTTSGLRRRRPMVAPTATIATTAANSTSSHGSRGSPEGDDPAVPLAMSLSGPTPVPGPTPLHGGAGAAATLTAASWFPASGSGQAMSSLV